MMQDEPLHQLLVAESDAQAKSEINEKWLFCYGNVAVSGVATVSKSSAKRAIIFINRHALKNFLHAKFFAIGT